MGKDKGGDAISELTNILNKSIMITIFVFVMMILVDYLNVLTGKEGEIVGSVTILYDHNVRGLMEKLTDLQHENFTSVLTTVHVHLDEHHCLEVIIVRGEAESVKKLADRLIATKGVKHGKLVMTSTSYAQREEDESHHQTKK